MLQSSKIKTAQVGCTFVGRRSDDQHMVALGGMEKDELKGLDISIFSRAPPEAMITTLEHLRRGFLL